MSTRVGIIGLGGIARKAFLPVLGSRADLELFFCSRTLAGVGELKALYRVSHGSSELETLLDWAPQAAFVLTPSETHTEIVTRLLEAGVDVFVEKPATLATAETRALAELADAKGRILMVGFNRRFAPLHRKARQLWGGRPIGFALLEKHRDSAYHPDLYTNYIDDTIHIIDLLRFFCGDGEVACTLQQIEAGMLVGANSTVVYPGGGHGVVSTSLQAGSWYEHYALHGGGASLFLQAFYRLVIVTGGETNTWEETYASAWKSTLEGRGFVGEIEHFFECLRTRQQPETSGWEAWKTQTLLDEMCARVKG
jgi:virulence factor